MCIMPESRRETDLAGLAIKAFESLCSIRHCNKSLMTNAKDTTIYLSFFIHVCLFLSPAPDEAPSILSVTPHTTTSVLICWQVRGRGFTLCFLSYMPPDEPINHQLVITEQEGEVCMLNTCSQRHPGITVRQAPGSGFYLWRWKKGE